VRLGGGASGGVTGGVVRLKNVKCQEFSLGFQCVVFFYPLHFLPGTIPGTGVH
jgi:hypothetical protein